MIGNERLHILGVCLGQGVQQANLIVIEEDELPGHDVVKGSVPLVLHPKHILHQPIGFPGLYLLLAPQLNHSLLRLCKNFQW